MTIKEYKILINKANAASEKYYNAGTSELSDAEFDNIIDQITQFETESGTILSSSPTQTVGSKTLSGMNEVKHEIPMLSLKKCHTIGEVLSFSNKQPIIASVKCDGLSMRLTYDNGKLTRAETRGDGEIGSDCTDRAKYFENIEV